MSKKSKKMNPGFTKNSQSRFGDGKPADKKGHISPIDKGNEFSAEALAQSDKKLLLDKTGKLSYYENNFIEKCAERDRNADAFSKRELPVGGRQRNRCSRSPWSRPLNSDKVRK